MIPKIAISIEAGRWPPEPKLLELAERAVDAAEAALRASDPSSGNSSIPERSRELSIVFTNDPAMQKLNRTWRGKDSPTNVLSFPLAAPAQDSHGSGPKSRKSGISPNPPSLLGDVILSAETIAREAALADKPLEDHMAHLIIHGYLHLLGFDHEAEADAEKMEQLERVALRKLGVPDPYATASQQ